MKINQDVIEVLAAAECDSNMVRLIGQLDRKTYLATNKVLKALGGKWRRGSRKVPGAHVWPEGTDVEALVAVVVETGEVTTAREVGFFETPPELAARLVEMARVQEGDVVLEPSAGTGRIVDAVLAVGARVLICERDERRRSTLLDKYLPGWREGDADHPDSRSVLTLADPDFMEVKNHNFSPCVPPLDAVCMNPPFTKTDHIDHVRHAFGLLRPGGVLVSVLPRSIKWRQDKKHRDFRDWYEGLGGEVTDLPDDAFKESGTSVRTCVLKVRKP